MLISSSFTKFFQKPVPYYGRDIYSYIQQEIIDKKRIRVAGKKLEVLNCFITEEFSAIYFRLVLKPLHPQNLPVKIDRLLYGFGEIFSNALAGNQSVTVSIEVPENNELMESLNYFRNGQQTKVFREDIIKTIDLLVLHMIIGRNI